jgi:hypothetical protein
VIGTSATDSATVSGTSGTPTGSVTFTLYSGSLRGHLQRRRHLLGNHAGCDRVVHNHPRERA